MKCETCKFWNPEKLEKKVNECFAIDDNGFHGNVEEGKARISLSDPGYAELLTSESFYCNMWEKIE